MIDPIERQAALDCFHDWIDKRGDIHTPDEMAEYRAIEALPSVQPEKRTNERTETHARDCISRQEAIEVIDAVFPVDPMKSEYAQWIACGAALAKTYVEQLPSAQPERKRGKWLRYGEDGNPNEVDTVFWQCDQCLERYTGRTTRIPHFCPNCGADMRGDSDEA